MLGFFFCKFCGWVVVQVVSYLVDLSIGTVDLLVSHQYCLILVADQFAPNKTEIKKHSLFSPWI